MFQGAEGEGKYKSVLHSDSYCLILTYGIETFLNNILDSRRLYEGKEGGYK